MLSTLPVEILHQICESLVVNKFSDGLYDPHTLNNLSLCSRQLKSICQPLLYSAIGLYSPERAALLRRTCCENAGLARQVHHVDVILHGHGSCLTTSCVNCMSSIVGDLLEALPDLRHLNLIAYTFLGKIAQVFDHAIELDPQSLGVSSPLSNLVTLELDLDNHTRDLDMNNLFLPTIKDLTIRNCRHGIYEWDLDVPDLQRLVLTQCELSVDGLFDLLTACSGLSHVQYQWIQDCWYDDEFDNGGRDVAPRIVDGLLPSRLTLQHLDISGESSVPENAQGLGDLTVFPYMTVLKAPLFTLCEVIHNTLRVCRLPACLRHLEVFVNGESSDVLETAAFQKLVDMVRDARQSPRLQKVVLVKDMWLSWTWSASLEALMRACTERGLTLECESL